MAHFLFKRWHEKLFFLNRKDVLPQKARVDLIFIPIDAENAKFVREFRADIYEKQFKQQLSCGDFGYYACVNGTPIG